VCRQQILQSASWGPGTVAAAHLTPEPVPKGLLHV
jgi:hypothetical protein